MRWGLLLPVLAATFVPVSARCAEPREGILRENGVGISVRLRNDTDDGEDQWEAPAKIYEKDGRFYVTGVPGASFGIGLYGSGGRRYEFVISIDGLSVMTGRLSSGRERGYVVSGKTVIPGWRRGNSSVARFEFTDKALSYAALTDRPENVGVIGVRVYDEVQVEYAEPSESRVEAAPGERRGPLFGKGHDMGTGYGDEAEHRVRPTDFERNEVIAEFHLEYASAEMLREAGVIRRPDSDDLGPVDPFPADGPFVPRPRGWRKRGR